MQGGTSLEVVIGSHGVGTLELATFGSTDPKEIAASLALLVSAATGESVADGLWYAASIDVVAGAVLSDGRPVIVRAYQRDVDVSFIAGVVRVQEHLAQAGFPCAVPLSGALEAEGLVGRVESMLVDPGPRRFDLAEMAGSAQGLARLVTLADHVDSAGLEANPMSLPAVGLYPKPHSPVSDFEATADGAQWIDDIAAEARARMTDGEVVISHGDWSARNVRLDGRGLVCAFDWESLQVGPEPMALGIAAATWRALGKEGEPLAPPSSEVRKYVEEYERARGQRFSVEARRSAHAAAVYCLAYTARCEHALRPGDRTGRATGRLSTDDGLRDLLS